jgi:hypothetical protein
VKTPAAAAAGDGFVEGGAAQAVHEQPRLVQRLRPTGAVQGAVGVGVSVAAEASCGDVVPGAVQVGSEVGRGTHPGVAQGGAFAVGADPSNARTAG